MKPFAREILEIGAEDFTPLGWVEGLVRGGGLAADHSAVRRHARDLLRRLWAEGLIEFFRGGRFSGEEVRLTPNEVGTALEDELNWDINLPVDVETVEFVTTIAGRNALSHP